MKAPVLYLIVGPSAVGKSEISLRAAGLLGAEIVSCDALQVYREIAIASDKPSARAQAQIPHHLIGAVSVSEEFNVARWRQLALSAIEDIQGRGKTALVAGGSGMYMSVLLDGIFEGAGTDENLRQQLAEELSAQGPAKLHGRLKTLDPKSAAKIHPHDPQRILRALEVVSSTGRPISELQPERHGLWGKMPIKIFGLNRPRQELYQRVDQRVDAMLAKGLVEEVKRISTLPLSATAAKLIGVPEIMGHLKGEYDLERAGYLIKLHTRHYVKRQLTWFRRDKRIVWIDIGPNQTAADVAEMIAG